MNFKKLLPILIICLLGTIFHYNHMNDFPSHTHAWAQSDRYAISKSFVNNGLNLFEPETYLLNPQFPDFWETPQKESITSVDFPIHDYVPAVFTKITGVDSPWVVRLYNLLYSFLGLFFLYKLALFYLNNELKALFVLVFAATSPVFIFYQNSFIPTIPSLANAIIGIYFYANYSKEKKNKDFNYALFFMTLAALSRTTFLIPLIAILGTEFIQIIRKKAALKPKLVPILISLSVFVGYYFYNKYLRSLYGSSFLDTLMNADDLDTFVAKLKTSIYTWGAQYFSIFHYYILILVIGLALVFYLLKKQKTTEALKQFNFFLAVLFIGNLLFAVAMVHQFMLHDYYFLDSFYLPIILLLIPILAQLPSIKITNIAISLAIISISFVFIKQGIESQENRYTYNFWEDEKNIVENYQDADKALQELGYGKEAKVLIFESFAPNLPLLVLNRKGFAVMANRTSTIEKALTWDYDVIVIRNETFLSNVYSAFPDITTKITPIWRNNKITICKLSKNNLNFNQFFNLDNNKALIKSTTNIADSTKTQWENLNYVLVDSIFSVKTENEIGPVFSKHTSHFFNAEKTVFFEGNIKLPETGNVSIIASISNKQGQNLYYKVKDLKQLNFNKNKWSPIKIWLNIPEINEDELEFKIYLYNTTNSPVYSNSLSVSIF